MTIIDLQISKAHKSLNILAHIVVVVLALLATINLSLKLLVLIFTVGSYLFADHQRRKSARYIKLLFSGGEFTLVEQSHSEITALKVDNNLSSPWLIILNFAGRSESLVLFKDAMSAEAWRKLRVTVRTLPNSAELKQ